MTDEIRNPNEVDPVTPIDRLYSDWSDPVIPETEELKMNYPTQLNASNLYIGEKLILENHVFDFEKKDKGFDENFLQGVLDFLNENHVEERSSKDMAIAEKHGIPVYRVNAHWKLHDEDQIGMRGWFEFKRETDGRIAVLFCRGPHDDLTNFVGEYPKL